MLPKTIVADNCTLRQIDEGGQKTVCHACMRGVASSSTHCGRKTFSTGVVRKDDEYCALCSSAAVAVAIAQLQLQLSHYSLVALEAFCFPECDF